MGEAGYRGWERRIARALRGSPRLKLALKRVYQRLSYLRYRKPAKSSSIAPVRCVDTSSQTSFFGYYDRSPENDKGYILFHRLSDRKPERGIELVVKDLDGHEVMTTRTNVYNWQQGARALWLDDRRFVFNRCSGAESKVIAVVADLDGNEHEVLRPVQDVYKSSYFLSVDVQRMSLLQPEYGYPSTVSVSGLDVDDLDSNGIWRVDCQTGESRLLYSLAQARRLDPNWSRAAHDLFNHIVISPTGQHFLVLHRWYENGVRCERLLLGDSDGGRLTVLTDHGMISHCAWINGHTVLGYMRGPSGKEGYWLIDTNTSEMKSLADGALDGFGDGHPSVWRDWVVTDTYPDRAAQQTLLMCNWKTGAWIKLGEFFHPFKLEGGTRCDLHPRWSPDGARIYFDSAFSGHRCLYAIDLEPTCFPS